MIPENNFALKEATRFIKEVSVGSFEGILRCTESIAVNGLVVCQPNQTVCCHTEPNRIHKLVKYDGFKHFEQASF